MYEVGERLQESEDQRCWQAASGSAWLSDILLAITNGISNGHDGVKNEYDGRSELGFMYSIAADAADSLVERYNHIEKNDFFVPW
jgi:hypothetical protein